MPTFDRKTLRRNLATSFIHDLAHSAVQMEGSVPNSTTPIIIGNSAIFSNTDAGGQNLYERAWLYVESSINISDTAATWQQYQIGSYNYATGQFVSGQKATSAHNPNCNFEVHTRIAPKDKDYAIDDTIKRIRIRREVGLPTIDGALFYTIDGAASPNLISEVLDIHLMANPTSSLDLDIRHMDDWKIVTTATGRELRLKWGVAGSQQIVLDAILAPSLGGELATIDIPDERWILAGAAMRCYDFMIQNAPGQQVNQLMQRRAEHAAEYTRLSARFMPTYDHPVRLHDTIRGMTPRPWDSGSNFW